MRISQIRWKSQSVWKFVLYDKATYLLILLRFYTHLSTSIAATIGPVNVIYFASILQDRVDLRSTLLDVKLSTNGNECVIFGDGWYGHIECASFFVEMRYCQPGWQYFVYCCVSNDPLLFVPSVAIAMNILRSTLPNWRHWLPFTTGMEHVCWWSDGFVCRSKGCRRSYLNIALQRCMSPVGRAPSRHHASHGDGLDWQQQHSTM